MIAIFANDLISKTRAIIMKLSKLPWLSVLTLSALCLVACKELDSHNEYRGKVLTHNFTDPRDNQSYPVVNIGSQVWMAANLNYEMSGSYCSKNRLETYWLNMVAFTHGRLRKMPALQAGTFRARLNWKL